MNAAALLILVGVAFLLAVAVFGLVSYVRFRADSSCEEGSGHRRLPEPESELGLQVRPEPPRRQSRPEQAPQESRPEQASQESRQESARPRPPTEQATDRRRARTLDPREYAPVSSVELRFADDPRPVGVRPGSKAHQAFVEAGERLLAELRRCGPRAQGADHSHR
ncbi:MAG: hypothetical protein Kow0056_00410 [Coriobacteriia bacterium]